MPPIVIPGYAEEIAREQLLRDAAFAIDRQSICGFDVMPMTTRMHLRLALLRSPFLITDIKRDDFAGVDKVELARAIFEFLWIIHPHYRPESVIRKHFFFRRVARMRQERIIEGILEYVEETFWDLMDRGGAGKAHFSHAAGVVHMVATRYGWPCDQVLDMPIRQLLQFRKIILGTSGGIICNRSDRVKARWRERQNQPTLEALKSRGPN